MLLFSPFDRVGSISPTVASYLSYKYIKDSQLEQEAVLNKYMIESSAEVSVLAKNVHPFGVAHPETMKYHGSYGAKCIYH